MRGNALWDVVKAVGILVWSLVGGSVMSGAYALWYWIAAHKVDSFFLTGIGGFLVCAAVAAVVEIRKPKQAIADPTGHALSALEESRDAIVRQFIDSCGTGNAKGFLEWLLNHRDVKWDRIMQACVDFGLNDTTPQAARDLGLLSLRTELHPFGWGNEMRKVLFYSAAPQFEAAIARVIYPKS